MNRRIALTLFFAIAISIAHAQTADDILKKYFENTGGLEKLKKLKSITIEGKVPTPQGEFPLVVYSKAPNKRKVVVNVQGKELVQVAYDGTTAWSFNPFTGATDPIKLDEEQTKEVSSQEFQDSFIDYAKKGHVVTLEGTEEIDGVKCYKIKLEKNKTNDKDDVTEIHYFDSQKYIPVMRVDFARSGPMKGSEVKSYMSDYREVDGIKVPFLIDQRVGGNSVSKVIISKLSFENIEDSVFAFPKK
jgi:hypothetical protein